MRFIYHRHLVDGNFLILHVILILSMIKLLAPTHKFKSPVIVLAHEASSYDFSDCAKQIYGITSTLFGAGLLDRKPYKTYQEVLKTIGRLLSDIDFNNTDHQISELKYVRLELFEDMLSIEFFLGV